MADEEDRRAGKNPGTQPPGEPKKDGFFKGRRLWQVFVLLVLGALLGWIVILAAGPINEAFETCDVEYGTPTTTTSSTASEESASPDGGVTVIVQQGGAVQTDPPETDPPVTDPPETDPPVTDPDDAPTTIPEWEDSLAPTSASCTTSLATPAAVGILVILSLLAIALLGINKLSLPGGVSVELAKTATKAAEAAEESAKAATAALQVATASVATSSSRVDSHPIAIATSGPLGSVDELTRRAPIDDEHKRHLSAVATSALIGLTQTVAAGVDRARDETGWETFTPVVFRFDRERRALINASNSNHRYVGGRLVDELWSHELRSSSTPFDAVERRRVSIAIPLAHHGRFVGALALIGAFSEEHLGDEDTFEAAIAANVSRLEPNAGAAALMLVELFNVDGRATRTPPTDG